MRSRALPLALALSGVLHAAVIAVSHNAAPTLTPDPTLVYSTQLEAVLIDAVQDKGETLLPSEAAAESAAADPTDPVDALEREVKRLQDLTASQQSNLEQIQAEHNAEKDRHEKEILALREKNRLAADDHRHLQADITQLRETRQAMKVENTSLAKTLAETESDLRAATHVQVSLSGQVKTLTQNLDLQQDHNRRLKEKARESETVRQALRTEKQSIDSENEQLTASLAERELALEVLHEKTTELEQGLLSSREASLELEHQLDSSIATARIDRQVMAEERATLSEEVQVISGALYTQRNENQRLRDEADQVRQILAALKVEQQEAEAAYSETDTRLLETTSALRSISEENNKLRDKLARSENTTANLKKQLDHAQASTASLETGNALHELRPVPTAGNPKPVYPRIAIRRGIEGEVGLSVSVSPSGQVSRVSVSKPSGFAILDQAAIDSVKKWEFTPATRNGVPTPMVIDIPVQFRLINSRS